MSDHSNEVHSCLKKIEQLQSAIEGAIADNQETVRMISGINQKMEASVAGLNFFRRTYGAAIPDRVNAMPEQQYTAWIDPLRVAIDRGRSFGGLAGTVRDLRNQYGSLPPYLSATSATLVTSSGDSAVAFISLGAAAGVPPGLVENEIETLIKSIQLPDDIDFIAKKLSVLVPDLAADFKHFTETYYSHADKAAKYVELIGFRTLMYFRFIWDFAVANSIYPPGSTRQDQIRCFLYGKNTDRDKISEDIVSITHGLWQELSDQDPTGNSLKTGHVNPVYVELLFCKAITVLAALLRQRGVVFQ